MFRCPDAPAWTLAATLCVFPAAWASDRAITGVGTPLAPGELDLWDISVTYDGDNLPPGEGDLWAGEEIWAAQCAVCHGDFGEGQNGYPKMLGADLDEFTQTAIDEGFNVEIRGINNLWAHAPTLYDMIRRAMPYFLPHSLSDEDAYSVTGYALYLADILDEDTEVINADVLRSVEMPAARLYYTDTRPDVQNERCMADCVDGELTVVGKTVEGTFGRVESSSD
ncbi:MAG: c-type cytochrome [Pseudomonadota bacterium]